MSAPEVCTMCGEQVATMFEPWPGPVCAECDWWLRILENDLMRGGEDRSAARELAGEIADAARRTSDRG